MSDKPAKRIRLVHRIGVGENQNFARGLEHTQIQPRAFSQALRLADEPHRTRRELSDDFVGAVIRTVRNDNDFQEAAWIVERESVPQFLSDNRFFVIGRDEECDTRKDVWGRSTGLAPPSSK